MLQDRYIKIINDGFRQAFPQWDSMSPLDPIKMIAEGVTASMAAVEAQQHRLVDSIIDTLPALFGFLPKKSILSEGYFQFQPSIKLARPKMIPAGESFTFQTQDQATQVAPIDELLVLPITNVVENRDGLKVAITMHLNGKLPQLVMQYVPEEDGRENKILGVSIEILEAGQKRVITFEDLKIVDLTESMSSFGDIIISLREGVLSQKAADIRIVFELANEAHGHFMVNIAKCSLFVARPRTVIGKVKGEPWESHSLDSSIQLPPDEIEVSYPDGRVEQLNRIDQDILKLRHTNPDRFGNSFYYDGSHHAIVIPMGQTLLGSFNGGVTLMALNVIQAASAEWLSGQAQASLGDYVGIIEKLIPLRHSTSFVPRESSEEYFSRFYAHMRQMGQSQVSAVKLSLDSLEADILNSESEIRAVEMVQGHQGDSIKVYLLNRNPKDAFPARLEKSVCDVVNERLSGILPLEQRWTLHPFQTSDIDIKVDLKLGLDPDRVGVITAEQLNARVDGLVRKYFLPAPFGPSRVGGEHSQEGIISYLKRELCRPRNDHSELRGTEITGLRVLIFENKSGLYCDRLARHAGQVYQPSVEGTVEILAQEVGEINTLHQAKFANVLKFGGRHV